MKKIWLLLCLCTLAFIKVNAFDGNRAFIFVYGEGNDHYGYFIQMQGKEWGEFDWKNNRKKQTYTCISEHGDDVLLKDNVRKLFIRLSRNQCYMGKTQDDVHDKVYDGEWRTHMVTMNLSEFRKKAGTYFVYEKYGIQFLIARPKPAQPNDIWYAFDYSNWIDLKHLIVQYECRDYIILSTLRTNEAYKITKDKIYKASSAFGSDFKEWATGAWCNGQDYDVSVALKNDVRDSLYRILTIRSLGYQQLKEKGLDTVKLKLMADDIAKFYLHEMKTDQLKFLDSTVMSLSVYDKKKHEVSIVYQGDLYNVPMTAAEYESLQKNNTDGLFSNKDYYFNGHKFKLCSFTITDPVTKKTFRYNAKTRVMERKTMLIETGSVSIKMPSE